MFNQLFAIVARRQKAQIWALGLTIACLTTSVASAANYDFMTITGNGTGQGNNATSLFTSVNMLGTINVTHSFSPIVPNFLGPGPRDNDNPALFPSNFSGLFAGATSVQGHLAMTQYGKTVNNAPVNSTSTVTFNLMNYNSQNTIFGIWNTTTEANQPPYRLEYLNANNVLGPPTNAWQYLGNTQNLGSGVNGTNDLVMNLTNGNISAGASVPNSPPQAQYVHTNAAFWRIPAGTQKIIVHGNLSVINGNTEGDGVGYYFADMCPTSGNLADLIANGGMICNGDKKFSNFAYHPIGDMPPASLIDVVSTTDSMGNLGIRFIGPFVDQPGGGPSEALLEYKVTATDPNQRITDVHLAANANVVGQSGYATITETFLPEDPNVVLEAFDFQPGGRMLTDWADLTQPQMMLHVQKDITLNASSPNSLATISFIDQTFSQTRVPEPSTLMLGGLALIGAAAARARRDRKSSI